jgi:hypothetical protein
MIPNFLFQLSDWNPQFFREVKGRLKSRNVALTVAASGLVQLAILVYFGAVLPSPEAKVNRYCTGKGDYGWHDCVLDALGYPQINWQIWWGDIFQTFSWLLPFVLLVAGVYMLIGDLAKEERRGTLNFLRLSPQASQSILIGKLLGVPLIPLLAVALAVPFHLWAAAGAGIPWDEVAAIYLVTAAACCFFYTAAIFYAFLGGAHGWLGAVAVWLSYSMFYGIFQSLRYAKDYSYPAPFHWFYLAIGQSLLFTVTFAVVNLGIGTFWIWQAINRRFGNPNLTLISKRQSYAMTASFEGFLLGFVFYPHSEYSSSWYDLMSLLVTNLVWFLLLIAALTPHRQTLLDWTRYRRDGVKSRKGWRKALVKDLIWGDKSPAMVAIALNLVIPTLVFTPWILGWDNPDNQLAAYVALLFNALFLLICAAIAQSVLFMKAKKRSVIALGVVGALTALPPIAMAAIGVHPGSEKAVVWLFSAFAFVALENTSATMIGLALLTHILVLAVLTTRLSRQLRHAGESELKALMAQRLV